MHDVLTGDMAAVAGRRTQLLPGELVFVTILVPFCACPVDDVIRAAVHARDGKLSVLVLQAPVTLQH